MKNFYILGESWVLRPSYAREARFDWWAPEHYYMDLGLRLVRKR